MKASIRIKSVVARILYSSGLVERKISRYARDGCLLLMYHRVLPGKQTPPGMEAGMYVEPHAFAEHLRFLKSRFTVVPLAEAANMVRVDPLRWKGKPACALTFDDGWRDFHDYAYPLLKENGVCATVFLPTNFIGTMDAFWTDRLAHLLLLRYSAAALPSHTGSPSSPLARWIEGLQGTAESRIEKAIGVLKRCREEEIREVVTDLSDRWGIDPPADSRSFLDWEEIREMRRSGLVSFGSHTASHRILPLLKHDEIMEELIRSREKLISERAVDPEFIPFCYPNGDYDERIAGMVRDAGYQVAVTTGNGWCYWGLSPFSLQRISIHQDMASSKELFGCRITHLL